MQEEPREIEVEIVEIDGVPVEPRPHDDASEAPEPAVWSRYLQRLPRLWWPLWVIIGIIAVALLLTVGVAVGILYLAFRVLRGIAGLLTGKSVD